MDSQSGPSQAPQEPKRRSARRPVALIVWLAALLILAGVAAVVVWNAMNGGRTKPVAIESVAFKHNPPLPPGTPLPPATRPDRPTLATPPSPVPPPRWIAPATQPATTGPAYFHGMRKIVVSEGVFLSSRLGRLTVTSTIAGQRGRVMVRSECLDGYAMEVVRLKASSEPAWQSRAGIDTEQAAILKRFSPFSGASSDKAASPETMAAYDAWLTSAADNRQSAWEALLEQIDKDVQAEVKASQKSYQSRRADLVRAVGEEVVRRLEMVADTHFAAGRGWPKELVSRSCDLTVWAGNINIQSRLDLSGKTTARIQPMFWPKPQDKNLYDCLLSVAAYSKKPLIPDLSDAQLNQLRQAVREADRTPLDPLPAADQQKLEELCEKYFHESSNRQKAGEDLMDAMTAAAPPWEAKMQERASKVIATVTPVLTEAQVQYLKGKTPSDLFPPPVAPVIGRPATR